MISMIASFESSSDCFIDVMWTDHSNKNDGSRDVQVYCYVLKSDKHDGLFTFRPPPGWSIRLTGLIEASPDGHDMNDDIRFRDDRDRMISARRTRLVSTDQTVDAFVRMYIERVDDYRVSFRMPDRSIHVPVCLNI